MPENKQAQNNELKLEEADSASSHKYTHIYFIV